MSESPAVDGGAGAQGGDSGSDSGTGMFDGGIPSFGLSRRQMLLIGLVVVAVLAWQLHSRSADGTSAAAAEVEKAKEADLGDVTISEEEDREEVEISIPANPDDELEQDAAVLDYLRDAGHIGGEDS